MPYRNKYKNTEGKKKKGKELNKKKARRRSLLFLWLNVLSVCGFSRAIIT